MAVTIASALPTVDGDGLGVDVDLDVADVTEAVDTAASIVDLQCPHEISGTE